MCKSRRDPQHALVFTGESDGRMSAERRALAAQVHSNVENFPQHHADQLSLRALYLVMQPAKHVSSGIGVIVLHKLVCNADLFHDAAVITLEKKPAIIAKHPRLEDEHTLNRCLSNFHNCAAGLS